MNSALYVLNFYSPVFVDQLRSGRKTATIRLGDKSRKYKRGQVVWITIGYRHQAREKIFAAVIDDVEVIVGDGSRGHPGEAPYDAIAVHAATPEAPHSLLAELATDGRLVVPIATGSADLLVAFIRETHGLRQETIGPCRFVPLIGAEGFNPPESGK